MNFRSQNYTLIVALFDKLEIKLNDETRIYIQIVSCFAPG